LDDQALVHIDARLAQCSDVSLDAPMAVAEGDRASYCRNAPVS
jgi:hypothetical protein